MRYKYACFSCEHKTNDKEDNCGCYSSLVENDTEVTSWDCPHDQKYGHPRPNDCKKRTRTRSCQDKSEILGVPRKRNEIGCCYPMGEG